MGTQPRNGFKRVEPPADPPPLKVVTADDPPTVEQCENAAMAMGLPILPPALQPSYYAESMRNLHALIVRALNGDDEAARTIARLQAAFAAPPSRLPAREGTER